MNRARPVYLILFLLSFVACSADKDQVNAEFVSAPLQSSDSAQQHRDKYLAYSHQVSIELESSKIEPSFRAIIEFCNSDTNHDCTLLKSNIDSNEYPSASLRARISPSGVKRLIQLAASDGSVTSQSTLVEDLKDSIVDNQKRLEMLKQYQAKLVQLEKEAANDVDSAIKIAEELSQVQSNIEYSEGEKAKLLKRTKLDLVDISLLPTRNSSFWATAFNPVGEIGFYLSDGISTAIITFAYLLPWFVLLPLLLLFVRLVWRKIFKK